MNWLKTVISYGRWLRSDFESTREYWDKNLEHNPLRGRADTSVGAMIAFLIEAAGDILREYSQDYRDAGYINEKINRLKRGLNNDANFIGALSSNEIKWISEIKSTLVGLPTPSQEIEYIKTLILQILVRELTEAKLTQQMLHGNLTDQKLTFEIPR